jgi:glycosyltransferase involved in cell wall biosynthesis
LKTQIDKLKIAFCLSELRSPDTTESFFLQQMLIASRLQARGHSLRFFAPVNLDDIVSTSDFRRLEPARRTWTKSFWFGSTRKVVWRAQQAFGIPYLNYFSNISYLDAYLHCLPMHDIVWERYGIYKVAAAMASKRLKIPYVLFFDGDDLYEHEFAKQPIKGVLKWRAQQMTRFNLNCANRIICVSNAARKRLVTVWGVPEQKVRVFPNAVDVTLYRPSIEEKVEARQLLGIGENPLILFVGGFFYWHDVSGLLKAFAIVIQKCPDARLVLIGDGIQHAAMIQYAHTLQLDPYVIFKGSVPHAEIPRFVNAADIAVAPYLENPQLGLWGSPMKLFEYMACGTAVVATSLGQITEVIQDGSNGLLTPASDTTALASAIIQLINNPELRMRLGQQARRDTIRQYSWDHYISQLENVYQEVMSCGSHKIDEMANNG